MFGFLSSWNVPKHSTVPQLPSQWLGRFHFSIIKLELLQPIANKVSKVSDTNLHYNQQQGGGTLGKLI